MPVRTQGAVEPDEITPLYVGFPGREVKRPRKLLKAFARTPLQPGRTPVVRMRVALDDLRWWDPATRRWRLEAGAHTVHVGGSSTSAEAVRAEVVIG